MEIVLIAGAVAAAGAVVCAFAGSYVADVKGRPPAEGAWLGGLLGPIGVLVEALLPESAPGDGRPPDPREAHAAREAEREEDAAAGFLGSLDADPPSRSIRSLDRDRE